MRRRGFLRAGAGVVAAGGIAGCLGDDGGGERLPPVMEDRPQGVYVPTHSVTATRAGQARAGDFAVAALVSRPTRFWVVEGRRVRRRSVEDDHALHVSAVVWDPETGVAFPETGVTVAVETADGDPVTREVVYPMVDQRMGFHYGDNFALPGAGQYEVVVGVAGLSIRRTGALAGRFGDGATARVSFAYEPPGRGTLPYVGHGDRAGEKGAVSVAPSDVPAGIVPPADELAERVLAEGRLAGMSLVVAGLDEGPVDGDPYLALSARTPYNRLALPSTGFRVELRRDGSVVHEGRTERTVAPDLGYHYGIDVAGPGFEAGDELAVEVTTPPQVARHEGYETAFASPASTTLELG